MASVHGTGQRVLRVEKRLYFLELVTEHSPQKAVTLVKNSKY